MRKQKVILVILVSVLATGFSLMQAQTEQVYVQQFISEWLDCANGGAGEMVEGTIEVHLAFLDGDAGYVGHPQGQYLTGVDTGIKYRSVGATVYRVHDGPGNGASNVTYINRFHFVGKGTHFYVKENFRLGENSNGVTVDYYNVSIECK